MKRTKSESSEPKRQHVAEFKDTATETWIALGECSVTVGSIDIAIRSFDYACRHDPSNSKALIGLAQALRLNDIQHNEGYGCKQAIERINANIEKFGGLQLSYELFKELAECYLVLGLNEQAHHAVQSSIQLNPKDPLLWLLNAQTLIRVGATKHAASSLNHCISILPKSIDRFTRDDIETARAAHAELGAIYAAEENITSSIAELTATLSLPPPSLGRLDEYVALWCALATAKERANDVEGALEACEDAEAVVGNCDRIFLTHAYLLLIKNSKADAEKAIPLLQKVVSNEMQLPNFFVGVELDEKTVEASSEGDFLPWYLLGKAYALLKSPRLAYDCYQIALTRASNLPVTWLAVGRLYLELKQLPDALAAYSQALRLQIEENSIGTATAWDGLSCVYERSNDQLADASDACARAATCFKKLGKAEEASFFDERAQNLISASKNAGPVPPLREPPEVPNILIRDLMALLPCERIEYVQGSQKPSLVNTSGQSLYASSEPPSQVTPKIQASSSIPAPTRDDVSMQKSPRYPQHIYQPSHANSPIQKLPPPIPTARYPQNSPGDPVTKFQPPGPSHLYTMAPGPAPFSNQHMIQRSPNGNPQYFRGGQYEMIPTAIPGHVGRPAPMPPGAQMGYPYGPYVHVPGGVVYTSSVNTWNE